MSTLRAAQTISTAVHARLKEVCAMKEFAAAEEELLR